MSAPAFADPVFQSQATFRALLRASSRPGEVVETGRGLASPAPLNAAAAATLLTLCDYETPLWLDAPFADGEAAAWLRFHTGAPTVVAPARAAFALLQAETLDLSRFARGAPEYPDRSTTLVVQVAALARDGELSLAGPGVEGERRFAFGPRAQGFLAQWRENGAAFPLGVDLILACGNRLAALPRTTRIREVG